MVLDWFLGAPFSFRGSSGVTELCEALPAWCERESPNSIFHGQGMDLVLPCWRSSLSAEGPLLSGLLTDASGLEFWLTGVD